MQSAAAAAEFGQNSVFLLGYPPRVRSNVNLLETCGQRKRDREKEDNHDVPPQKTSKSSGLSAAWSFMAGSKNK